MKLLASVTTTRMVAALKRCHYDIIDDILKQDPGCVNVYLLQECTPLIQAIESCPTRVVRQLLMAGANTNQREPVGHMSPLDVACVLNRRDVVKLLLAHGADINPSDINAHFAHPLPTEGYTGPRCEHIHETYLMDGTDNYYYYIRPPVYAAMYGGSKITSLLLKAGANPNAIMTYTCSYDVPSCRGVQESVPLLIYAVTSRSVGVVARLLRAGADVNCYRTINDTKSSVLACVVDSVWRSGHDTALLRLLLKHGANLSTAAPQGWPFLFCMTSACQFGGYLNSVSVSTLKLLLAKGCDPNARSPTGQSLAAALLNSDKAYIHRAGHCCNANLKYLLQRGLQVDMAELSTLPSHIRNQHLFKKIQRLWQHCPRQYQLPTLRFVCLKYVQSHASAYTLNTHKLPQELLSELKTVLIPPLRAEWVAGLRKYVL